MGQSPLRQTLGVTGSSAIVDTGSKKYYLHQSIGQYSVINTFNIGTNSLRQGFIQPLNPSAIDAANTKLTLTIYPNPFVSEVQIDFNEVIYEDVNVSLFDLHGRLVLVKQYPIVQNLSLPLNTISSGGYLIQVLSGTKKQVKKLIKF